MKRNTLNLHKVAAAVLLLAGGAVGTTATADEVPAYISTVSNDTVRVNQGKVQLSFTLDLGEHIVSNRQKRVVTPMLCTPDGDHSLSLPAVVAYGRQRSIKAQRTASERTATDSAYVVLRGNKDENRYVNYQVSVPFSPWMDQARFCLREEATGCAGCPQPTATQVVKEQALYSPALMPAEETGCPHEFVARHEERDAFLIYPVNQTRLYDDRYGNRTELDKIDSALQFVQHNPAYEIRRIYITGYASPEGRYTHNVRLAEGRAEALKQYIEQKYTLPDTLLVVTPGAENWQGLADALHHFELPYKDQVQAVAADTLMEPDQREARLRAIGNGMPYATLLRSIYPSLRKNTFRISYISRERTPEEARRLVFTQPEELNVYEFYAVAQTYYANDSAQYARVLLIAADTYPQHAIANNNAARICLRAGDTERAAHYLQRTHNEPFTWTNRGTLLWMQGEHYEAIDWWKRAADNGDETAKRNLQEAERRGY